LPVDRERLDAILARVAREGAVSASAAEGVGLLILAAADVFGVTGVGILLADAGQDLRHVASTDPTSQALEEAQERTGEGPCVDAYVEGRTVHTADLRRDERWPELARAVAGDGVRAVLGVPTRLEGSLIGTLNAYARDAHPWDQTDIDGIEAFNRLLESQLASAVARFQSEELVGQLQRALEQRVSIDRAIGILMERERLDARGAFNHLRRRARDERRRADEVAREILESRGSSDV
jgi:GAF domain-containing protein